MNRSLLQTRCGFRKVAKMDAAFASTRNRVDVDVLPLKVWEWKGRRVGDDSGSTVFETTSHEGSSRARLPINTALGVKVGHPSWQAGDTKMIGLCTSSKPRGFLHRSCLGHPGLFRVMRERLGFIHLDKQ